MTFLFILWIKILIYGSVFSLFFSFTTPVIPRLIAGVLISSILAQCLNFFLPINPVSQLVFDLIVSCSVIVFRTKIKQSFLQLYDAIFITNNKLYNFTIILLGIAILLISSERSKVHDVGFYYLQSIKWIQEYPVIPGLGNLFTRLANNSNWFYVCALFNPSALHPSYPANSLLFFLIISGLLKAGYANIQDRNNGYTIFFSCGVLAVISLFQWRLESQNTDVITTLLLWLVAYTFYEFVKYKDNTLNKGWIYLISFIALYIPTIKLNYIPVTFIPVYFVVVLLRNRDTRTVLNILLIGLFIYLPWITRFVIISGYLIFPVYQIDLFNFDWKMPREILIHENDLIRWWARAPYIDTTVSSRMSPAEWIPVWIISQNIINKMLLTIFIIGTTLYIKDIILSKLKTYSAELLLFIICLISVILCLLTAPDLRFCYGFLILIIIIEFKDYITKLLNVMYIHKAIPLILIISILLNLIKEYRESDFALIIPQHNYPKSRRVKFINGIPIFMAQKPGEILDELDKYGRWGKWWLENHRGIYEDRLWDADLPASPYIRPGLTLRGNNIRNGFKIEKK